MPLVSARAWLPTALASPIILSSSNDSKFAHPAYMYLLEVYLTWNLDCAYSALLFCEFDSLWWMVALSLCLLGGGRIHRRRQRLRAKRPKGTYVRGLACTNQRQQILAVKIRHLRLWSTVRFDVMWCNAHLFLFFITLCFLMSSVYP